MTYKCLVIDNSSFFKTGRIRVRLFTDTTSEDKIQDLSTQPTKRVDAYSNAFIEEDFIREGISMGMTDVYAVVTTPIGGAFDYGLWYLPQPNTWGIVSELSGSCSSEFVWLGATYPINPIVNNVNAYVTDIGAPSDVDDMGNQDDKNIFSENKTNINNQNSIVIKTKHAEVVRDDEGKIKDDETSNKLNWKNRPLENIIIIDGDKLIVKHVINELKDNAKEGDDPERTGEVVIRMDKSGLSIKTSDVYEKKTLNTILDLESSSFKTSLFDCTDEDNKVLSEISGDLNKLELSYIESSKSQEKSNCNITVGKTQGLNGTGNALIKLTQASGKGKYSEMTMEEQNVTIIAAKDVILQPGTGGKVCIGDTDSPVLISPTGGDVRIGSITIPVSKYLKA